MDALGGFRDTRVGLSARWMADGAGFGSLGRPTCERTDMELSKKDGEDII